MVSVTLMLRSTVTAAVLTSVTVAHLSMVLVVTFGSFHKVVPAD